MIEFFPSRTVALELAGFSVHWYGLMYFFAFLVALFLLPRLQKYRQLSISKDDWASILSYAVIGVIVGGRLGYVFLYDPAYFLENPVEILKVWNGGMASHGGFVGVLLALLLARYRVIDFSFFKLFDVVVVPVAIGLALGRVGNFINLELYGTVTDVEWAIAIPGVEGLRHPVQAYAVGKNLLLALVCYLHLRRQPFVSGQTAAIFLMLYAVLRFSVEFFREQPHGFVEFVSWNLSWGQVYTIPLFVVGLLLFTLQAFSGRSCDEAH